MAKTRSEINKAYYLKHKAEVKQKKKIKYRKEHDDEYITVKNIPMHKEIGEFLINYLNTHKYFDSYNYNKFVEEKGARTAMQLINMLKHNNRFIYELTDIQKNNILLAACYRYLRTKGQDKSVVISNETTREHANGISNGYLKYLDGITSNTKQSEVRRLDGYAYFDVEYIPKIVGGSLVTMKRFYIKDNNPAKDKQMLIDLKMTKNTFKAWKLYTKTQMLNLINGLLLNEMYYKSRNIKDITKFDVKYKGIEREFQNYHTKRTKNEELNKKRMLALRVSEKIKQELDELLDNDKEVDYQKVCQLSKAIKTDILEFIPSLLCPKPS